MSSDFISCFLKIWLLQCLLWLHLIEGCFCSYEGVTISWHGFGGRNNLILYSVRVETRIWLYFLCPCIRVHSLCSIEFPTHVICRTGGIRTTERGSPFLKPCCITKGSCNLSTENSNLSTQEKLSSPSRNFYMFVDRGLVNLIYITPPQIQVKSLNLTM